MIDIVIKAISEHAEDLIEDTEDLIETIGEHAWDFIKKVDGEEAAKFVGKVGKKMVELARRNPTATMRMLQYVYNSVVSSLSQKN